MAKSHPQALGATGSLTSVREFDRGEIEKVYPSFCGSTSKGAISGWKDFLENKTSLESIYYLLFQEIYW